MARPIVYGPAMSPYVWSARMALAEKGVAHELIELTMSDMHKEPHLSRHPFGKVPAFEHDGFTLYETQAILRYIDEAFPAAPLQPIELHPFSRMNQIMGLYDAYLAPALLGGVLYPRVVAPLLGQATDEAKVAASLPRVRQCLGEIARLAGDQEFLAGEMLSLADLMVAPALCHFKKLAEGRDQFGELPVLAAWHNRLEERQSLKVTRPPGV
jgi:glutathione S-transferase